MIHNLDAPIIALLDQIREVAPDLSIVDVRIIEGQGQNNRVIVVDERLIFRFPRYVAGVAKLEREIAILRAIRPHLTVATPDPILTSLAETTVGKAFVGYPLIPGEPLGQQPLAGLADDKLFELGEQVGTFLRQLHAVPVAKVLPDELARFDPVAPWRDLYARIERQLFSFMRPDARAATSRHFAAFFERAGSLD